MERECSTGTGTGTDTSAGGGRPAIKVVFVGRAGSGKTRLLRVIERQARALAIPCRIHFEAGGDSVNTAPGTPVWDMRCAYDASGCHFNDIVVVCAKSQEDADAFPDIAACRHCERWINSCGNEECDAFAAALLALSQRQV
jgi:hypothetical protein